MGLHSMLQLRQKPVVYEKEAKNEEEFEIATKLLPLVREKFGERFKLLEIPEVVGTKRQGAHGTIVFKHYGTDNYNKKWTEATGGAEVELSLSSDMVQILADLQSVDVPTILDSGVAKRFDFSEFDTAAWKRSFKDRHSDALTIGLSEDDIASVEGVVSGFSSERPVFSNGDFYPRNIVRNNGHAVLLDWEPWDSYRVRPIDQLENLVAFAYIHMWGNPAWQQRFLDEATGRNVSIAWQHPLCEYDIHGIHKESAPAESQARCG